MIRFQTTLHKFDQKGEKTGWTYIAIPAALARQLKPGAKQSFRVKGKIDAVAFEGLNLLPMGEGNFILAVNATLRKAIKKQKGATVQVQLALQKLAYQIAPYFMDCLLDEPAALQFFNTLTSSHRNYFSKWIESAKTEPTRIKRITLAVNALSKKMGYPEMIRAQQSHRNNPT